MRRFVVLGLAAAAAGCGDGDRARLEIRTTLPESLRDAVETTFEALHPDIDLRFSDEPDDQTLEALAEGDPGFDVWWGAPASALMRAGASGALAPSRPAWVPVRGPGAEGTEPQEWHPWLTTPLVIAFDRTAVALADAPTDWIDVFHHAWFEDVRVPDPAATEAGSTLVGAMVVEALRDDDDLDGGFDWLARLHDQVDQYVRGADESVSALGSGDALLAIMTRADAEEARTGGAPWLHYRLPASGTPEVVLGVAVVAGARLPAAARAFLDYLGSDDVATAAKRHTHWEPMAGRVDQASLPADFELAGGWRAYPPAFDTLAVELDGWIDRWEREVRIR